MSTEHDGQPTGEFRRSLDHLGWTKLQQEWRVPVLHGPFETLGEMPTGSVITHTGEPGLWGTTWRTEWRDIPVVDEAKD